MFVLGLTGKTGAGKSTVATILKENGFYIIDGDKVARQVTEKGSPVLVSLAHQFGDDIINSDGSLNRALCGARAFSSKENTEKLNEITHGTIDALFRKEIETAEEKGFSHCVIDAAALLESPSRPLCDKIAVVHAPEEIRLQRILSRDNIEKDRAAERIKAQKSDNYYFGFADFILNNYSPYSIEDETERLIRWLKNNERQSEQLN